MKEYRNIIEIDKERCNGCGQCVLDCAEGAIAIIDGKATVVSESYCDGLGACLSGCPQNALTIVRREAPPFDEEAALRHVARQKEQAAASGTSCTCSSEAPAPERLGCGCSGTVVQEFAPHPLREITSRQEKAEAPGGMAVFTEARRTWPVKLRLVPPTAPFLKGADLLLAADCAPAASSRFHELAAGRVVLIACPKFEDNGELRERLSALFAAAHPASVTVMRMEVPCCRGLASVCREVAEAHAVPVREVIVGRDGSPTAS